ncbi:MAG TPA: S53 family peptidase [Rhizomicrobium sp.]|nr:S53 family peptidase [Rhizomicrobium sp.]
MYRVLSGGIMSAVIAFGFAADANAQVLRSGNTYHAAVCGIAPAGFARCHARIVTDAAGHEVQHDSSRISGFGPADLRDAYKITGSGKSATIIAVVDAFGYNNAESDLGVYRSNYGLKSCTTNNGCFKKLNQNGQQGNYPAQNIGWAQESALDLDMASAMCPKCQVWLVEANDNSYNNLATAVNTAASLGAHVISNSYGGGEGGTNGFESSYNHAGVAVTASTGDNGYAGGPQFPATSPHVIAVGGTHLVKDGSQRGWSETAWSGAGSGCSTVYAKPAWQKDAKCTKRMEADVSADADPATGVAVYGPNSQGNGTWLRFGGTSVSAPMVGGVYAVNGKNVKNYAKTLYKGTASVFDVTSGSNGSCGSNTYYCTAGVGYDGPTGVGTPNGSTSFH